MPLVHTDHDYRFKSPLMLDTEFVLYDMTIGESFWEYRSGNLITTKRESDTLWCLYLNNVAIEPITNNGNGFTYVG